MVIGKLVLQIFLALMAISPGLGEFIPPRWSADLEHHWADETLRRAAHPLHGGSISA